MFFPLYDENPLTQGVPWATWGLIGLNTLVFFLVEPNGGKQLEAFFQECATVPALLASAPLALGNLLDLVRSMFLHGDFEHLLGNMFFLFLFGDNVEETLGVPRFLALYFGTGLVAGLTHVVLFSDSPVPLVGASGAISGVLGAYLVLFPKVQVRCLVGFYTLVYLVKPPVWLYLAFWFLGQVASAKFYGDSAGTAFLAHVGGFLAGFVATFLVVRRWQDMEELVGSEGLRRVETAEEQAVLRNAAPTLLDSGLRVIRARKRPNKVK